MISEGAAVSASQSALRPPRRLVLADVLPGDRVRDAVLVATYAAFTGLAAQLAVKLPFTPVPITGQTFAVLLGAAALGWRRALAGMVLYLALGLTPWVPWFAEGSGGAEMVQAPSFATSSGSWSRPPGRLAGRAGLGPHPAAHGRHHGRRQPGHLRLRAALPDGHGRVGLATGLELGVTPFLAGDALKILLAAGLLPGAWALVGRNPEGSGEPQGGAPVHQD
jgi:biotin transport system substrate-specific component